MKSPGSQRGYLLVTVIVTLFLVASVALLLAHDSANSANTASRELEAARADYVAQAGMQHALWQAQNSGCMGDVTIPATTLGTDSYTATISGAAAGSSFVLSADQDAWIRNDDVDRNNGTGGSNHVKFDAGNIEQVLTRFDTSSLPSGSQVNSAIAWFHLRTGKEHPEGRITVHEILSDWDEDGVTWDSFDAAYRSAAVATIPAQDTGNTWVALNITGLVQAWVNGQPNNGILFDSVAEGLHTEYTAREDGTNPPRLEVTIGSGQASPLLIQSVGTLASGVARSRQKTPVTAYQPASEFEVTSGSGSGQDTMMKQDAQSNNLGANEDLWIQDTSGGNGDHSLLQFDLSGLPSSARIASATLSLHQHYAGTPGGTVAAHRITRDWDEGDSVNSPGDGVTWITYDWFGFWSDPGGDYDTQPAAVSEIKNGTVGRFEWDVTGLVSGWVRGDYPNHGLILAPYASGTDVGFSSSDDPNPSLHPRLTISYACECGTACIAPGGSGRIALIGDDWTPDPDDQLKIELVESWGYEVDFYQDRDSDGINWSNYDLAYVSETVVSGDVHANLTGLSIGVVNEEPKLYDDLQLASGDTEHVGSSINITDSSHFITSVFPPGPLPIYTGGMEILTADAPLADGLQTLAEFGGEATLTATDAGAETIGGAAAGRRVTLPFGQHFAAGFDWNNLDHNGYLLAQRAIAWAMGDDVVTIGSVLMVVGNDGNLTNQEEAKKTLLESWGYAVNVIDEDDNEDSFNTALAENDVVFVGEDVQANDVGNKLTDATIGIVIEEANLVDDLGMGDGIDWDSGDKITIISVAHYITQPFDTGTLDILDSNESLAYQVPNPAPGLKVLGRSDSGPTITAIEAGAELVSGGPAAGRRVLLPWGGNNMDVNHINDNGLMIFKRAIEWADGAEFDNGLLAHWKLDETSGTTAVDSEGGHDGTLLNGPEWSSGVIGGSVHFSEENHAISAPHSDSLTITGDLTLLAWVNLDELRPNRPIVQKGTSNIDHNYYFGLSNDNLQFAVSPPSGGWHVKGSGATGISPGRWHHLAVSFNDSTDEVTFYLDGAPFSTNTITHSPSEFAGAVRIGRNDNNYGIKGRVDDVRIYRRVLAAGEIADLFDTAKTIPEAHWKLDEASGSTAIDSIGGHDGTLTNGPVWTSGRVDGGLDFDGVDDYVDLTSDFGLTNIFDGGATVTAWIYPRGWGESENARILDKASAVSGDRDGWMIGLRGEDEALQFAQGFTGTRGFWRSQEDTIVLNEWVHIAVVYDASSVANDAEIYLDGVLQTPLVEITPTGTVASDEGIRLRMGNYAQDTSRTFDGVIDDVRIFDRMLNATEVGELAAAGGSPPIAHWMLDDGTGSTALDSAGGHDGTLTNGPVWVVGQLGDAVRFDGSNDRINVPHQPSLNLVAAMTLSAWVNADSLKPYQMVLTKGDNGVYENYWIGTEGNKANFGFVAGGTYYQHTTSGLTLSAGTWHHIAATYDDAANEVKIYVDGVAETFSTPGTPVINSEKLIIGNSYYGGEGFDGVIDDVRIYNGVLSATEIANIAAGGGGGGGGGGCSGTFRDEFNAIAWDGSNGTLAWSGPWAEVGESDGPTTGDVKIKDDDTKYSKYQLRIRDNNNGGEGVERVADLSGATTATLSFVYRRNQFDSASDYVAIYASSNGTAGPWTELPPPRIQGPNNDNSHQAWSRDISAFISATTAIRLRSSPSLGNTDEVYFDNIQIQCSP